MNIDNETFIPYYKDQRRAKGKPRDLKDIIGDITDPRQDQSKPLTFYFIRHGAAYHNPPVEINKDCWKLYKKKKKHYNTQLTQIGKFQAKKLYDKVFDNVENFIRISSPLDRAIETLILATTPKDKFPNIKEKFNIMRESTDEYLENHDRDAKAALNTQISMWPKMGTYADLMSGWRDWKKKKVLLDK